MKKWTVLLIIAALGLAGCSKRSTRNDNLNGVATINGFNPNCLNTGTFNNNLYNNGICGTPINNGYSYPTTSGFYSGYEVGYVNGFEHCPAGTFRAYGAAAGLSCIPMDYLYGHQVNYAVWYWNPHVYDFSFYGYYDYESLSYFESDPYFVLGTGGYDDYGYDYGYDDDYYGCGGGCGGFSLGFGLDIAIQF